MSPRLPVPIVNNARVAVTFDRQTANNTNRGFTTLQPDETHYEPGVDLTYETLVLKDLNGNFTAYVISMDELADDRTYERMEVTPDLRVVKHERVKQERVKQKLVRKSYAQKLKGFFHSGGESSETLPQ